MSSAAFAEFKERVRTDGYKQGYNEKLFDEIYPEERTEVEKIIVEKFNAGDYQMAIFMPMVHNCDGISRLEGAAQGLKNTCNAYSEIMQVLYNSTHNEIYLDNIINVLSSKNENERMNAILCLWRCGRSKKLYEIYKQQCLEDEDEDVRFSCVKGMYYCQEIINNPFRIQKLEQPWERLELEMFDCDRSKEERKNSILEFESLILNC